jgi:hypothetical protein
MKSFRFGTQKEKEIFPPFKDFAILIMYKSKESEGILKIMCRKETQTEIANSKENHFRGFSKIKNQRQSCEK